MSEWQPIETAPQDGTVIAGWNSTDNCITTVHWEHGYWILEYGERDGFCEWEPTHWISLPNPPTKIEVGETDENIK